MSGLLRRLTRRGAPDDESQPIPTEGSDPVAPSADSGGRMPAPASEQPTAAGEQPTVVAGPTLLAEPPRGRDLPAGVDPAELERAALTSGRRGKLRRRLRYLMRVRELLLRDAGGFAYEAHRRNAGGTAGGLLDAKLERLARLDAEVRGLEDALAQPRPEVVLHEAGVGGTCAACGEWHPSDARFCSNCGTALIEQPAAEAQGEVAPAAAPVSAEPSAAEGAKPSGLWWSRRRKPETSTGDPAVSAVEAFVKGGDVQRADTQPGAGEVTAVLPDAPREAEQTVAAGEQTVADEPVADEPVAAADVPREGDEPVADEPVAAADVPREGDEPVAAADVPREGDEPVAAADVPREGDEPVAGEAVADEPVDDERVYDERVDDEPVAADADAEPADDAEPRDEEPGDGAAGGFTSGEPLGQETQELPAQDNGGLTSGDPLGAPGEQRS